MKTIKKDLDELQKQILSGIESRGFWIAFWGSLILLIVQMIFANNIISVISSWLLFMVLAIYEAVSCLKAGIWNSSLYISKKNTFISSVIAICMGVFQFILVSQRGESTYKTIIVLVSVIAVTFFLCFSAIIIIGKAAKKRRDKLDAEPDDTMDKQ